MLNSHYLKSLGIELIINYNRKSRQDEEYEKKTGEDTLKTIRDIMDRVLIPLGIPYEQEDEIGSGDKISSRPVFQSVLKRLSEGKYQAIAVKEITRMGRGSYTDMGIIYDLIVEKCIYVITPYKLYNPKNPSDLRQIRFELFMSREEFETTKERLMGGRYSKALEGRWMAGKPPFGYKLNDRNSKLEINESEAEIVRMVFELYANGIPNKDGTFRDVGHRALCTYLTRLGVPSPKGAIQWYPSVISYMVTNEVYLGTMIYGATKANGDKRAIPRPKEEQIIVKDAHPAIVDFDIWIIAKTKDDLSKNPAHRKPRVRLDAVASELTGLIVCKKCGNKMIANFTKQRYKKRTTGEVMEYKKEFLWCKTPGCNIVKYRAIEEDIVFTMNGLCKLDQDAFIEMTKQLASKKKQYDKKREELIAFKEKRTQELKNRISFIYEKYESGLYNDDVFLERKNKAEQELAEVMAIDLPINEVGDIDKVDIQKTQTMIASFVEGYKIAKSVSEKNKILRMVFDCVYVDVLVKGRGSIPAKHIIYPVIKPGLFVGF